MGREVKIAEEAPRRGEDVCEMEGGHSFQQPLC